MKKISTFFVLFMLMSFGFPLCAQWELVWQDEFNGSISSDWVFETGTGDWGWGNNEQQYYRAENATVVNGALRIQARRENFGGMNYTSARLKTQGKRSFKYGKIEARISMPSFNGVWPAFWMLGSNITSVGWPACGEIDIMEHVNAGGQIFGSAHWDFNGHAEYGGNTTTSITNYHVYSIEWDEQAIRWYIDGNKYHEMNIANGINGTHELHNEHFIILNMAIGGEWPGYNIDNSAFPANMMVDYVRVYKKSTTSNSPVSLYQHHNYGGYVGNLEVGSYTLSQLQALGIQNDDVTSLKVKSGYKVTLYEHDNFGGRSLVKTSDVSSLVNDGFNDITSSVIVSTNSSNFNKTIEAENYSAMQGVQTEPCSEGGLNVGYIDAGDWMAYNSINIPVPGNYTVEYRVASFSGSQLSLDINAGSTQLGVVQIPATGGWQNWTTVKHVVYLNAGTYNFGIYAPSGGWNINWWRITQGLKSATVEPEGADKEPTSIKVYPVPASDIVTVTGLKGVNNLDVFNANGAKVLSVKVQSESHTLQVGDYQKGIYLLRVSTDEGIETLKFIVQ